MRHLTALLILCLSLSAFGQSPQPCQPPLSLIASQEPNIFSEEQEVDFGDAVSEHLRRDFRVIDDDEVTAYLARIGERIIKHAPATKLRFQFLLVDAPEANAYAMPGGRVFLTRKLIALARTEDEVAGVIAHEIGHLIARHSTIDMTRRMREVLGVTEVKDRRDIFEKYNRLIENAARKPKAFDRGERHNQKEQMGADLIGLYAMAGAGYDPEAFARFFDRFAETKGKTGNAFTDFFGITKPESRRLREMIKTASALPASCIETRRAASIEDFQRWQASVLNYTGLGRRESLHAVRSKITLDPPLRSEIARLRFSPDGRYLLAQDDSGISVLTREPFAPLFRIEAPEARPAQFTTDSQSIIFYNSRLRIETWGVEEQKLKSVHEVVSRRGCLQSALSPDGKTFACLDFSFALILFDVASGAQIFQKESFYSPSIFDVLRVGLLDILGREGIDAELDWINLSFSPDGRYFAAGARSTTINIAGGLSKETNALIFDTTTRQNVPLRGPVKKMLSKSFAFLASDRLIAANPDDYNKSAIISFPSGEIIEQLALGPGKFEAATRGNHLFIRPIAKFPVGVLDLSTKVISRANKQSAIDLYDKVFVAERLNGEIGLYETEKNELIGKVLLPRNSLGRLRSVALSRDMKWLAVSERTRGAVWNLTKGERLFHVRGFRGAHFAEDGALYADFPKFEESERTIARLDVTNRQTAAGPDMNEDSARQHGQFVVVTKPAKKEGVYWQDVIIEVHNARDLSLIWSRPFPKEAPAVWIDPENESMALAWSVSSNAAKSEIKADPQMAQKLAALKEKEGDYFLQVLDARTGKLRGRLLIETGKGSFEISRAHAAGDWVVITDSENRVLIYSLSTGEQKGRMFGARATISTATNLLCVENERGQLTVYDLKTMEKRDEFLFSSPVEFARLSADGKSLFVLTANQTAYVLDVSALAR